MSIEALNWALGVPVSGTAKVILLGLANHAGASFGDARPSVPTLARYAHCSRRTVQRYLRLLEAEGWIERDGSHALSGRADRTVTVWRLTGRQADAPCPDGVTPTVNGVTLEVVRGDTAMPPEPPINHPKPNSPSAHVREAPNDRAQPLSIDDERRALALYVQGILQRGIDGLTTDEHCKPVGVGAVLDALGNQEWDEAVAAAVWARSCAQSQNRAPNIVSLFAKRLAQGDNQEEAA